MRRIARFVAVVGFGSLISVVGCAADEAQAREASFPEPIGYTDVASTAPPPQPPPPPQAPPPQADWTGQPPPQGPPPGFDPTDPQAAPEAPPDQEPQDVGADGTPAGSDGYADTDPSALQDFRSTLDPYGAWEEDPTYGTVWAPSPSVVGPDFTPYVSAGHWAYDGDYVWESDYDWGWAPFHYGRWVYAGPAGWEWIPGRAYAGAWVAWRYGAGDWGYVGWAPLGPTWCWRGGMAVGVGFVPRAPYSFVGSHELFAPSLSGRLVTGPQVGVVAAHTQPYVAGGYRASTQLGGARAGGPPLAAMHVAPSDVVRVSTSTSRELAQARAYARPSTAVALGAREPERSAWRGPTGFQTTRLSGRPSPYGRAMSETRVPAYAAPGPAHFGGRMGAGFSGSASSAPPPRPYGGGPSTAYFASPRSSPGYGGRVGSAPSGGYRGYPASGAEGASRGYTAPRSGGGSPAPLGSSHISNGGGGSHWGGGGGRGGGRR
jgi:hypothetical protein